MQAGALPRFRDQIVMDLQQLAQLPRTPNGCSRPAAHDASSPGSALPSSASARAAVARDSARGDLQSVIEESSAPPIDVVAIAPNRRFDRRVESPCANIRITRARRASSARILKLRSGRSNSARSSVVNISAIWRVLSERWYHPDPIFRRLCRGTTRSIDSNERFRARGIPSTTRRLNAGYILAGAAAPSNTTKTNRRRGHDDFDSTAACSGGRHAHAVPHCVRSASRGAEHPLEALIEWWQTSA